MIKSVDLASVGAWSELKVNSETSWPLILVAVGSEIVGGGLRARRGVIRWIQVRVEEVVYAEQHNLANTNRVLVNKVLNIAQLLFLDLFASLSARRSCDLRVLPGPLSSNPNHPAACMIRFSSQPGLTSL